MAEGGPEREMELKIESALSARLQYFKDQADSLTLESVRRLLEKDLGLEKFALDVHKRFIKLYTGKLMDGAGECNAKPSTENVDEDGNIKQEEETMLPRQEEIKQSPKGSSMEDEETTEDSPIMGILTPKAESGTQESLSESMIEKAIQKRADYFLANTEKLTLGGVRRLLEEDLELDKYALDPFKKFISAQIDQVLNPPKVDKSTKDIKKRTSVSSQSKKSKKISHKEGSDASSSENDQMEEDEAAPRRKSKSSEERKKRKSSKESALNDSRKKQNKVTRRQKEEDSDSDNNGSVSEDGQSESPVRKSAQKKDQSTPGFGKRVEHLKSIIKACGMSVAPTIYKKAKQVPDSKREDFLVKELEAILSKEGLSKNPSEKEIKDCKKRKETARELEGIDMSNIISSTRRRSTFSFVSPPKPEVPAKAKKVTKKDDKKEEKNDEEQNDDNEEKDEKKETEKEEEVEEEEGEEEEDDEEEDKEDDDDVEEDESEEFNDDGNEDSD